MQVQEVTNEGLKREYKVTLPAANINEKVDAKVADVAKTISLPGFRRGKVPTSLVRTRHQDAILSEVLKETVDETAKKLLSERELRAVQTPKIDLDENYDLGKDLEYSISLETYPQIPAFDFSTLSIESYHVDIADKDIDEAIERVKKDNKRYKTAKATEKAADGDKTIIDFVGKTDGVAFEGGTAEDVTLIIGDKNFIPGFEEEVVGLKTGDKKSFGITFPKDYGSSKLAGKEATFDITVKAVEKLTETKVDDELLEKLNFKTVEEMREKIKSTLEDDCKQSCDFLDKKSLFDVLEGQFDFDIPESLFKAESKQLLQQQKHDLTEHNKLSAKAKPAFTQAIEAIITSSDDLDLPALVKQQEAALTDNKDVTAKDKKEIKAELDKMVADTEKLTLRRVRIALLLADVAKQENVQVTDEEIQQAIWQQAMRYQEQAMQIMNLYKENPQLREQLYAPIIEDKAAAIVLGKVKKNTKNITTDKLLKLQEEGDEHDHSECDHDH